MNVVDVNIKDLKPYENNPRKNDGAVEYVAKSINDFGFKVPIVIDKDNVIVAGHTRYKAAKRLKLKTVPCIIADDLSPEQIKAFRLADNKVGEIAEWDMGALADELGELADLDFDMTEFGFDSLVDEPEVSEDDFDEDAALAQPSFAERGDVWTVGRHRLMCGDSTSAEDCDMLMNGEKADLVVTDPPYNMGYEGAGNTKDRASKRILNDKMSKKDFRLFLATVYGNYCSAMKDGSTIYVFYKELGEGVFIQAMAEGGLQYKQELIWVKDHLVIGGAKYQNQYEPFLMGCKGKSVKKWNGRRTQRSVIESIDIMGEDELRESLKAALAEQDTDVIRVEKRLKNDLHPTMKPIRLLARLIFNSSDKGDLVCDLFGGSGSTLVACEQTERRCFMMELDPKYVSVIIRRAIDNGISPDDIFVNRGGGKSCIFGCREGNRITRERAVRLFCFFGGVVWYGMMLVRQYRAEGGASVAKADKPKKPTGRPPKEIDKDQFEKLCGLQCTYDEICGWFDVSDKTLDKWCMATYGAHFSEVFAQKREKGKISLRRMQWHLAEKSATMAIFLGKNYLGQSDNIAVDDNAALDRLDEILAETRKNAVQRQAE